MNHPIKVAVVHNTGQKTKGGHGTHLAFWGLPDVEIILVDTNTEGLQQRLRQCGAQAHYRDPQRMMEREHPDIMVICSRLPEHHAPLITLAAEHRCHVICEKPLTASLKEADNLATLVNKQGIVVAVAHLARYSLVFRTMKTLIHEGLIGKPLSFYGRGKEDERGGGEDMLVLGTHILDLGTYFFGKAQDVRADVLDNGRRITPQDRIETTEPIGLCAGTDISAHFRFPGGINGFFESRRGRCTGPVRMGITVTGTKGSLSVRYDDDRHLRLSRSSLPAEDESHYETIQLHEERILPAETEPFDLKNYPSSPASYFSACNRFMALDLLASIEEGRRPACSIEDAITTQEMVQGIYASSLSRSSVTFPLADRAHPLGE